MGRPVSVRASYANDGAYLLRLSAAVLKDESEPAAWRESTSQKALGLAKDLIEAESRRKQGPVSAGRRR